MPGTSHANSLCANGQRASSLKKPTGQTLTASTRVGIIASPSIIVSHLTKTLTSS